MLIQMGTSTMPATYSRTCVASMAMIRPNQPIRPKAITPVNREKTSRGYFDPLGKFFGEEIHEDVFPVLMDIGQGKKDHRHHQKIGVDFKDRGSGFLSR